MAFNEPADLIGSCESTLDTLGLLIGDMSEEVQDRGEAWTIAQVLNHLLDTERRYYGRVRRMRKEVNPRMRIQPDPDYTRLAALRAWSQFYELRQRHLKLLRSSKRTSGTDLETSRRLETSPSPPWCGTWPPTTQCTRRRSLAG
ncbi:MAG TPA: DinB family protein [Candidatus Dormibacteraeota bacterium]